MFRLRHLRGADIVPLTRYADDMGKVKLYKASAGSGKTHKLTEEYLRLLGEDNYAYRRILAVTFTNKATEEMKRRIVEVLFRKSKEDPRAGNILTNILHDYSQFNISTIDKFFQQALRAFAREIGKNSSYSVELDQDMILLQAIDQLILNLDREENAPVLEWLLNLSYEKIEAGENWDVKSDVFSTAKQLFREAYKLAVKESGNSITDKKSISVYNQILKEILTRYEDSMRGYGRSALSILKSHDLSADDFSYGKASFASRFAKLAAGDCSLSNDRFIAACNDTAKWFSKDTAKKNPALIAKAESAVDAGLLNLMNSITELEEEKYTDFVTAQAIYPNLFTLGILSDIDNSIREVSRENGIVLLSETTELLNKIIDGSDTPFIYEKMGTRLDHFMLDEFQDTSVLQWENFRPLVMNSLSSGYDNLIVGDVKQSIYRWRGSDWGLLNNNVYSDLGSDSISESELTENWRSAREIIDFNNDFFPYAAEQCDIIAAPSAEMEKNNFTVSDIYSGVQQHLPGERAAKHGYVEIRFFEEEKGAEETWKQKALSHIPQQIDALIESGQSLKDIAILVRSNLEGATVAEYLISKDYKVISEESLFLRSSESVSKIISTLRYYCKPGDSINNIIAEFSDIPLENKRDVGRLPLYEMCEAIAGELSEETRKGESVYILAFLDTVLDFVKNNRSDLSAFLEWWDEKGSGKSVPAPEGQDAVRVMTIHKSKGLGIGSVIIPFFTLDFSRADGGIMWCKPHIEPFNALPLVPVVRRSSLNQTHFSAAWKEEYMRNIVDNINLAYVAFTRAIDNLIVFAPANKSNGNGSSRISNFLYSKYEGEMNENMQVVFGKMNKKLSKSDDHSAEISIPGFVTTDPSERLKLSLRAGEFFSESQKARKRGVVIHSVLSRIYSESDIVASVKEAVSSGELSHEDEISTIQMLTDLVKSVKPRGWFQGKSGVYNELEILEPGGAVSRPDRVVIAGETSVIDFKTGKQRLPSHSRQISKYTSLLKEMNFTNVKGFIWYLEDNFIEEVV